MSPSTTRALGWWWAGAVTVAAGAVACVASHVWEQRGLAQARAADHRPLRERERVLEARSDTYHVDRIYKSMKGPYSLHDLRLEPNEAPQLLWITGYEVDIEDGDGAAAAPEFMCHSNIDVDGARHEELLGGAPGARNRLFTLSQGATRVRFPEGFGIPVDSRESLRLYAQVLNLNEPDAEFRVRQKVTLHYLRDRDAPQDMKALFLRGANGYVLIDGDDGYFGVDQPDEQTHGPGCAMGTNAGERVFNDPQGRRFSGHWVVPPGRHEYRSLVTRFMDVPFDTRIHHIVVHLHPFAESAELVDRTTGEVVFRSVADNFPDRIGLRRVDDLTSPEGVPIYRDHEYELVTVYDNTSGVPQDSMSVMFLYMLDDRFVRPSTRLLPREPWRSLLALGLAAYLGIYVWLRRRVEAEPAAA